MREFRLSFWHTLIPVLGLHGLLLAYPIDSERDLESKLKPGKPVRVITVPPAPRKAVQPVTLKSVKSVRPSPSQKPALALKSKPKIAPKLAAVPPRVSPPVVPPQPKPSPTPIQSSPAPTPSVPPVSANESQMEGTTAGCSGSDAKDCFVVAETNGRLAVNQIEAYFRDKKGYTLEVQPLDDEHGMMVYRLSKPGHSKADYLHVFWDENGTTYLRSPTILSHQKLALKVRQKSS
jgi:hypothetical protein